MRVFWNNHGQLCLGPDTAKEVDLLLKFTEFLLLSVKEIDPDTRLPIRGEDDKAVPAEQ